jgi:hypothetical protein
VEFGHPTVAPSDYKGGSPEVYDSIPIMGVVEAASVRARCADWLVRPVHKVVGKSWVEQAREKLRQSIVLLLKEGDVFRQMMIWLYFWFLFLDIATTPAFQPTARGFTLHRIGPAVKGAGIQNITTRLAKNDG